MPYSIRKRCNETIHEAANPFETEQLVLTSLEFLTSKKTWFEQAVEAEWDLLIVDEAHHLVRDKDQPSTEYQRIEALAEKVKGLILLTATPDQLGHESHFARLRLLDPDRFYDYQQFVEEESHYTQVADAANDLLEDGPLQDATCETLRTILAESDIESTLSVINSDTIEHEKIAAKKQLINQLLDRHGTGRILFRNTRHGVKGFPKRELRPHAMAMPEQYSKALSVAGKFAIGLDNQALAQKALFPEEVFSDFEGKDSTWCGFDPRVNWLVEELQALKGEKVIVICAHAQTALTLEQYLWNKQAIRCAVFHEGLSVFERDKAAAYFAQSEDSAQVLLCSEIGSEGRNFQFAHHLVLFDLPLNPDLLEQRIGRLDRIGQTETIKIHVPYFVATAQSVLFDWYHQGLDAFSHTCSTGRVLFDQCSDQLFELMKADTIDAAAVSALVEQTRTDNEALKQQLENGRDKLLEINSSGQHTDHSVAEDIERMERSTDLPIFMIKLLDTFGVDQEDKGDQSIILRPSEHMLSASFPGLGEEGCTITFDRATALAQEHLHFITWEHPMMQGAMDMITTDDIGNTSVAILKNKALPAGAHFVEYIYVAEAIAPKELQMGRYLPTTPIRILLDKGGNDLSDKVTFEQFNNQLAPVGKKIGSQLTLALQSQISAQLPKSHELAENAISSLQQTAAEQVEQSLGEELARLTALKQINPNIREDELDFIRHQQQQLGEHIAKAEVKLDAIRLIVVSHG